jgi:hypothetical protein
MCRERKDREHRKCSRGDADGKYQGTFGDGAQHPPPMWVSSRAWIPEVTDYVDGRLQVGSFRHVETN